MQIEKIPLSQLVPDDHNARRHDERNIAEVKKSLQQFGQHRAFVVQRGSNKILVGNGMYEAMRQLGWEEADVYFVDDDDATAVRRALADNRTAELAEWDTDVLAHLFDNFRGGADIPGWSEDEIDRILQLSEGTAGDGAVEDEAPEPPEKAVTKPGDVWLLGKHRLACGDSTDPATYAFMDGEAADMVFTDPPWNVNYGAVEKSNAQGCKPRKILNDFMPADEFKAFMSSAFARMRERCKPGAMVYVVMSAQEWGNLMLTLAENGFHWSSTIVWNKDSFVISRKDYHTKYEPIWYGWDGRAPRLHPLKDRKQPDVWDIPRPKKSDEHPTMKPVALVHKALLNSTNRGGLVLDLFGGSGTTLIAAEQAGRRCRMVELDPRYCDVIVRRWQVLTGADAILERTGKAFDSMT